MIIYNTTFHIEKEVLTDCLEYFKKQYIPTAASSGFLQHPSLRRIMSSRNGEGESYAVQFYVKNVDTLNYWLECEGKTIHEQLINRFGNKVAGFTTLLEEIDWEIE